jgi:tetratricopeptide (TPR) repeat protein
MNTNDYLYILNKPSAVNEKHTALLDKIITDFPYFQSARALRLKSLYSQNSFKYNNELKITASYTNDRSLLFDFITSDVFLPVKKDFFKESEEFINNIIIKDAQFLTVHTINPETTSEKMEQSIISSIEKAEISNEEIAKIEVITNELFDFSINEKHSFQEWLKLSKMKPIERDEKTSFGIEKISEHKKKREALIDQFIATNPKISAATDSAPIPTSNLDFSNNNSYLMTETLAKVYLAQKKYEKAIQAYEILILKYPEKSSFFADRITEIKIVQQNNN